MRCLAVDDEPLALSILENFCKKIPSIELLATAADGIEAVEILKKEEVDLLFIDINMPHMSGIEVVKMLENPPMVIFTTAYQNYALEGFEVSAIDYLLKPFSFDRFFKAVNRAQKQFDLINNSSTIASVSTSSSEIADYIMVKSDYSVVKLLFSSILYIEGLKDYVKIYTTEKNIVTKSTMKNIEERLPKNIFMRTHKSFVININNIDSFENNHIVIKDNQLPLGQQYKEQFLAYLNENKL
ncbi:MAG: LytTR family DNA-binding domain-containing protein [Rikenellaceae bacterium]